MHISIIPWFIQYIASSQLAEESSHALLIPDEETPTECAHEIEVLQPGETVWQGIDTLAQDKTRYFSGDHVVPAEEARDQRYATIAQMIALQQGVRLMKGPHGTRQYIGEVKRPEDAHEVKRSVAFAQQVYPLAASHHRECGHGRKLQESIDAAVGVLEKIL